MSDIWNIAPKVGVGPLRFGMTPDDVAALGVLPPVENTTDEHGEYQENRGLGEPLLRYIDGKLVEIVCDEPSDRHYTYKGVWVFDPDARKVVLAVTEGTNEVEIEDGYFYPPEAGLTFWYYIDRIEDGAIVYWNSDETSQRRMVVVEDRPPFEGEFSDYEPLETLTRDQL